MFVTLSTDISFVNFFKVEEYRVIIENFLKSKPHQGYGEISKIGKFLKVNPTLVSQVMSGTRDFTCEQGIDLANYLGLSETEAEYFLLLIQRARAGNPRLRKHFDQKLEGLRIQSKDIGRHYAHERQLDETEASVFYSSWLYSAIRVYTSTAEKGRGVEELCERFQISRSRAMDILRFLLQTGLCSEKNGLYMANLARTFGNQKSPHLVKHRSNWRLKAIQKLENVTDDEMSITSVMSISKKDFEEVRRQLTEFIKFLSKTVQETEAEDLAFINIDLLWVD